MNDKIMSSNVPSGTAAGTKNKPPSPYKKRGSLQYTTSTGEWREPGGRVRKSFISAAEEHAHLFLEKTLMDKRVDVHHFFLLEELVKCKPVD